MATRPSAYPTFDVIVPCDDVAVAVCLPAAEQAALEIAGRAAWLAWQIDAHQIDTTEALRQLVAIDDDLARFGGAFPHDVRELVSAALDAAHGAAITGNLSVVRNWASDIREMMEQHRHDMLV